MYTENAKAASTFHRLRPFRIARATRKNVLSTRDSARSSRSVPIGCLMVSSPTPPIMHVNPRSVLRPEYLEHSQCPISSDSCAYQSMDKRLNTNTAPIYFEDSHANKKKSLRRFQGHPYLRRFRDNVRSTIPNSQNYACTSDHPALRGGASTVPVRSYISSPESDKLSCIGSSSPSLSYTSRYSSDSVGNNYYARNNFSPQKTVGRDEFYSQPKAYTHGQAEQLRRSRESNTFALIDAQLSRSPLNQVRDMYLQNRTGCSSGSNSSAARTTKKVNLSVVHTVVRFRIKEYLRDVQEHAKRLLDTLFLNMFEDYDVRMRNTLASQLFGMTRLPCSSDCQFCTDLGFRVDAGEHAENVRPTYSRLHLDHRTRQNTCPVTGVLRPSTTPCAVSKLPALSTSDGSSDSQNPTPSSEDSGPQVSPNEPFQSSDSTSPDCPDEVNVKLSPGQLDSSLDLALEKPLLSYHLNGDQLDLKPGKRSRLDSTSLRLVNEFDSTDWTAEGIDFGPCGEELVDLHTLVADSVSDTLPIKTEESFFDPAYDPIDLLHQFTMDKFPNLQLASSP
ncbi:unnamed protein product [Calicophoron daubneyi]|uniref:Uncharacterized protein n=1 Tax=Calicophoron daubneyi TaxID=300641 RepID=A0AAV2T6V1_CALDB